MSTERWKIQVSPSASSVAHSFKTWLGMLSGPTALSTLIFCRSFSTPCLSILRSGIGEYVESDSSDDGCVCVCVGGGGGVVVWNWTGTGVRCQLSICCHCGVFH